MTVIDFVPSALAPFEFQPTLDGQVYRCRVPWSWFGQRYYLEVSALSGTLIALVGLIGSPDGFNIESLRWDAGVVHAVASNPHGFPLASTVDLTITGALPAGYNGAVAALITGRDSFSFPVQANPGQATAFGMAAVGINLVGAYFSTASIVYREAQRRFEIGP